MPSRNGEATAVTGAREGCGSQGSRSSPRAVGEMFLLLCCFFNFNFFILFWQGGYKGGGGYRRTGK